MTETRASRLHRETAAKIAAFPSSPDRSEGEPMANDQEQADHGVTMPAIYHCTPLTPRAALEAIGIGRNFCVSFWRPDDVEAVERIARTVMFRQRRIFRMAGGNEARRGMVYPRGLDAILSLAGAETARRPLGDHSRCAWRAVPAQRRAADRLAIPARDVGPRLAHGCTRLPAAAALRSMAEGLHGMDRRRGRQGRWLRGLVRADVGNSTGTRRALAADTPLARRNGRARISLCQCGQQQRRAERVALWHGF